MWPVREKWKMYSETITYEALLLLNCRMSAFFLYESETDELKLHSLQDKSGSLSVEETLNQRTAF